MIIQESGVVCQIRFTVLDTDYSPVTGITLTEFSARIYDPTDTDVSGSITVTWKELGGGDYEISFTPVTTGKWYVVATHATYFPWGKAAGILVSDESLSTIGVDLTTIINDIAALNDISINDIFTNSVDGSYDLSDILKIVLAMLGGVTSGVGTNTEIFKNPQGTKNRVTFTFDANNNRVTVGFDLS